MAVSLFDITMSCAKMAEPIEMLFGMWTRMSPRVGFPTPQSRGNLGGGKGRPCDAAFSQNSLPTCCFTEKNKTMCSMREKVQKNKNSEPAGTDASTDCGLMFTHLSTDVL